MTVTAKDWYPWNKVASSGVYWRELCGFERYGTEWRLHLRNQFEIHVSVHIEHDATPKQLEAALLRTRVDQPWIAAQTVPAEHIGATPTNKDSPNASDSYVFAFRPDTQSARQWAAQSVRVLEPIRKAHREHDLLALQSSLSSEPYARTHGSHERFYLNWIPYSDAQGATLLITSPHSLTDGHGSVQLLNLVVDNLSQVLAPGAPPDEEQIKYYAAQHNPERLPPALFDALTDTSWKQAGPITSKELAQSNAEFYGFLAKPTFLLMKPPLSKDLDDTKVIQEWKNTYEYLDFTEQETDKLRRLARSYGLTVSPLIEAAIGMTSNWFSEVGDRPPQEGDPEYFSQLTSPVNKRSMIDPRYLSSKGNYLPNAMIGQELNVPMSDLHWSDASKKGRELPSYDFDSDRIPIFKPPSVPVAVTGEDVATVLKVARNLAPQFQRKKAKTDWREESATFQVYTDFFGHVAPSHSFAPILFHSAVGVLPSHRAGQIATSEFRFACSCRASFVYFSSYSHDGRLTLSLSGLSNIYGDGDDASTNALRAMAETVAKLLRAFIEDPPAVA